MLQWCLLAVPAGLIVSILGYWSFSGTRTAGVACGIFVGLLWGDLFFTKSGFGFQSGSDVLDAAISAVSAWDALVWICLLFTVGYLLFMSQNIRVRRLMLGVPAGGIFGVLLMGLAALTALLFFRGF